MRELKFRAFNLETKTMIYLDPLQWPLKALEDEENWKVMQFTGLKDREGKEIWEGDIVRWNEEFSDSGIEERTSEVIYQGHGFFPLCAPFFESIKNCEVLGNIYSNPELLNQKEEV